MLNVFSESTNKLKDFKVTVGEVQLEKSTISSIEIAYDNTRPIVRAQLYFADLYDMNMITDWSEIKVEIVLVDVLDDMFVRSFNVVSVDEPKETMGRKSMILNLVDEFSYKLSKSYISRSFDVPLNEALMEIIEDLEIDKIPFIDLDFSEVPHEKPYMTVKNSNTLTYFTRELYRKGYTFYQSKNGIHIKSLEDLTPRDLPLNGLFSDHSRNQYYMNKIIESDVRQNDRTNVEAESVSVAYDSNTKEIKRINEDPLDSLRLNSKPVKLNEGTTTQEFMQSQLDPEERKLNLKREYMDQNILQIWVAGFIKNDLNQIYETAIKGNETFTGSQQRGDESISGKYISKQIQEKIIGGNYAQMITLHRADRVSTLKDEE